MALHIAAAETKGPGVSVPARPTRQSGFPSIEFIDPILRGTPRAIRRIEASTTLQVAAVRAQARVATEMIEQVNHVAHHATMASAILDQVAALLSRDVIAAERLRQHADMAQLSTLQIQASLGHNYCEELRR